MHPPIAQQQDWRRACPNSGGRSDVGTGLNTACGEVVAGLGGAWGGGLKARNWLLFSQDAFHFQASSMLMIASKEPAANAEHRLACGCSMHQAVGLKRCKGKVNELNSARLAFLCWFAAALI